MPYYWIFKRELAHITGITFTKVQAWMNELLDYQTDNLNFYSFFK